nr:C4-dicarboxylate ABC transporter substrate-binding protein [Oceanospirillaceae bacterium]
MNSIKKIAIGAALGTALSVVSLTAPLASAGNTFISIGTGGPTGVYFVVGNSICRMVHKEAAEGRKSGRKHGIRCAAPSTGGSNYNIGQIGEGELDFGVA